MVKADGKYWCINPGVHLCGLLHAYDMNWVGNFTSNEELVTAISGNYGVTVPNLGINVYPADTTPIDIGESQSSESAIKCSFYNNSKILVGPYKFDWTYSNTQMTSYEILDNNGTNITSSVSICDAQGNKKNGGLPKGEEFYLLVSSTVDSVKININLSASEKRSGVRGGYNVLTPISGGEGYCSETITQTLFYIAVEPYEVTVTDTATLNMD